PAPCEQLLAAPVVGPALDGEEPPLARAYALVLEGSQEPAPERGELLVHRLGGLAAEVDGQPQPPPLELAAVEERPARQGHQRDCGGPVPRRREGRGGARLVVVFEEADHPLLPGRVGGEVLPDRGGVLVREPVVEAL